MEAVKDYRGKYKTFKDRLDRELQDAAEGFVRIGYMLKIARDTNVLEESGYRTVAEFAKAEYGLTKDIVSRYIAINDRFSEGGYSEKLKGRYQKVGVSKLAEMLTLPDEIVEAIPLEMTKDEIRTVKEEIREEEKVSDLEVMMEEKNSVEITLETLLQKFLYQYFMDFPENYPKLHTQANQPGDRKRDIADILQPSGAGVIFVRPAGTGKLMLSIKGEDTPPELVSVKSGEKETVSWQQLQEQIKEFCPVSFMPEEAWEKLYGKPYPKEEQEEAKSQPKKEERVKTAKKPEKREAPKKDEKPKADTQKTKKTEEPHEKPDVKQSPIEEVMPKPEVAPVQPAEDRKERTRRGYLDRMREAYADCIRYAESSSWNAWKMKHDEAEHLINLMKSLEEEQEDDNQMSIEDHEGIVPEGDEEHEA